jgi:hypothetical protein
MLKKALILGLVLIASFGVMLLTTRASTFVVQNSQLIVQDPVKVWQVLADVELWPEWWPGVETARLDSFWAEGEQLELVFKGNPADGPAQIDRYQIGLELAFSREGVLGSRASTALRLESQPGAVLVTVVSMVRGPQAFLARFTGREAFAAYHKRLLDSLSERAMDNEFPGTIKEYEGGR